VGNFVSSIPSQDIRSGFFDLRFVLALIILATTFVPALVWVALSRLVMNGDKGISASLARATKNLMHLRLTSPVNWNVP